MYLHMCTNERHKSCILSMQPSEMLLYALNLGSFILGFAIYPVAYGVVFTLQGLPIVTWISNFKQQTIVGGQYFNVPKPTEFWVDQLLVTHLQAFCNITSHASHPFTGFCQLCETRNFDSYYFISNQLTAFCIICILC